MKELRESCMLLNPLYNVLMYLYTKPNGKGEKQKGEEAREDDYDPAAETQRACPFSYKHKREIKNL